MNTSTTKAARRVRVQRPERQQIEWRPAALDQMIPADHRVRLVWADVDALHLWAVWERGQQELHRWAPEPHDR